ncbi:hypothetical protein V6N13_035957 [Hibiscus sabdariffa]|uniref:Uncharacterized protein n=1 Tax=Hibiscus sabdariffa TaxID=183260 RepID=A0ABR2S805_9ROSI
MANKSSTSAKLDAPLSHVSIKPTHNRDHFFVWREFVWGAIAGAFGEGMMHPIDTIKTRIQSQALLSGSQSQKSIVQMVRTVWVADGLRGFYRGIAPGITGSLATGATYFGVIESTKKWIEESHPNLGGHWAHFIAGAVGDTLGSFVYVPCEVIKQRMQVQGSGTSWNSAIMKDKMRMKSGAQMYGYYTGMFQAGCSIWKEQGLKGLYAGYGSTLARDVPFAGLMVMFYEALKDLSEKGRQKWAPNFHADSTFEGLVLGGLAGDYKFRDHLQVSKIWKTEGPKGMFRGSVPRITWYIPASALTFMAVEFLRDQFNKKLEFDKVQEVSSLSIEKPKSSFQEVA